MSLKSEHTEGSNTPHYDLVVSLGTDYHSFERLVDWVDDYLAKNPEITCLFQHGFTKPSAHATENVDRMPRAELLEIYQAATAVVVQGGPGSILDAREVGLLPLAVPRRSELDEVVDNHQIEFSRVMQSYGETHVVASPDELAQKIDEILANPEQGRGEPRIPNADLAADKLASAVEHMPRSSHHDVCKFVRRWAQIVRGLRAS